VWKIVLNQNDCVLMAWVGKEGLKPADGCNLRKMCTRWLFVTKFVRFPCSKTPFNI
jgi:hypothetical protein